MSAALDHGWDLLAQIALDDDPNLYPAQLFIVAVDLENMSEQALEHLDKGMTVLVMLVDGSQCLFAPALVSWWRRRLDRLRGRVRVRIELRPSEGPWLAWHAAISRAGFVSETVPRSTER